ncbi:hypothetical protein B1R27_27115 [Streptomyces sp. GKU 895]|nr:hypothetical protein B1R27_27115 [Streptomyces sp. GKU 895]
MAGESPDRSKQRESSAEPTSGSAGPVPEARTEVRDPRLAVARDAVEEAGSTADAGPEPRGGVDTATRVFSVRDVAKARESAARADAAEASSADAPEDAGSGEGGDSRLRPRWPRGSARETARRRRPVTRGGRGRDDERADAAGTETDGQAEARTEADGERADAGPRRAETDADSARREAWQGAAGGAAAEAQDGHEAAEDAKATPAGHRRASRRHQGRKRRRA